MTCLSENNSIISNYFPKGWEISATAKAGEQGKGRSMFSLKTLILATFTMDLLLHGQMTGLQEQEICTARCTLFVSPFLTAPYNPSFFRALCSLPWRLASIQATPVYLPLISFCPVVPLPLLHGSYSLLLASVSLLLFLSKGFLFLGLSLQNEQASLKLCRWIPYVLTTQEQASPHDVPAEMYATVQCSIYSSEYQQYVSSCCKSEGCVMTVKHRVELHLLIEWRSFNYLKAGCMRNDETPHKSPVPTEVSNKLLGKWIWRTTISDRAAISLLMQIP